MCRRKQVVRLLDKSTIPMWPVSIKVNFKLIKSIYFLVQEDKITLCMCIYIDV